MFPIFLWQAPADQEWFNFLHQNWWKLKVIQVQRLVPDGPVVAGDFAEALLIAIVLVQREGTGKFLPP